MSDATLLIAENDHDDSPLKRSITGRLLFFYVLGDVLGSGIYVLIGLVAAAVGGAFWIAFAVGITIATITGLAYAELVTKYPKAAGAALYVNKAFGNRPLTFLITVCMLSASFAAAGSLVGPPGLEAGPGSPVVELAAALDPETPKANDRGWVVGPEARTVRPPDRDAIDLARHG